MRGVSLIRRLRRLAVGVALALAWAPHEPPASASPLPLATAPLLPSLHVDEDAGAASLQLGDPLREAFGFDRFETPQVERPTPSRSFIEGRWGRSSWGLSPRLSLTVGKPEVEGALLLTTPADDPFRPTTLTLPPQKKPCKRRAVTFVRYGAEQDTFALTDCEGSVAWDALERLSIIARPPNTERPAQPLPDEPSSEPRRGGEWVPDIRLLNPRMLWVLQRIADAFPRKTIYVISGYRPHGHGGFHAEARAIDLFVMGVANERVYKVCRKLQDVGCGYYPNNRFVHIDTRPPGTGKAFWIDTSAPGEPSKYVDSWPGVEAGGAAVWARGAGE